MELTATMIKKLQKDLEGTKSVEQLMGKQGAIKNLLKTLLEAMYQGEMDNHLGYAKHSSLGDNSGNSRNGSSKKTLNSDYGEITVNVPRDRNGEFDPLLIKKYEKNVGPIEERVISMYARGMSTRDIQQHIEEIYALELSPSMISNITDKVLETVKEWQNRPLENLYPIVFLDAIHFNVRSEGKVIKKAAYTCLGIGLNGIKEVLGIWIGQSEGAHLWLSVLTDLKTRGVKDILIACVDGLPGFPEAINTVFPMTIIQPCVIHAIRNLLKRISVRERLTFMRDLKPVYRAPTLEAAELAMEHLELKWSGKYSSALKIWRNNWPALSQYFSYPEEIRRTIYTTNAVEALHRQFRKVTKTKSVFPSDDALRKILFLSIRNISEKWQKGAIAKWQVIMNQLNIIFKDRLNGYY
jgi:putative transposase